VECNGFAWQGFGSGGATGVAPVRSCQKLPPCPMEPMPASSKLDPPLAKVELISISGSASGIICLKIRKKKKKALCNSNCSWREEGTPQTPRSVQKEWEEVLQAPEQRFPCSLWSRPW